MLVFTSLKDRDTVLFIWGKSNTDISDDYYRY